MKKNKILARLFSIVFVASFVIPILNSANTFAAANALVIDNAEIVEYSPTAEGYIDSFEGGTITGDITFHQLNDYVKYNITIKNVTDIKQTIESITDNNTSEYITFTYDAHEDFEVAAGDSFDLLITVTYTKLIEDPTNRAQTPGVKLIINYSDEFDLLVPKTGTTTAEPNATSNYLPIAIVSAIALTTCVVLFVKKYKQTAKIVAVLAFACSTISIASIVNAEAANNLDITFASTVFNLNDQIRVTYYDVENVAHDIYVEYNAEGVDLPTLEKHNYDFVEWRLDSVSGLPLEDFGNITTDIELYPVFVPHEYSIEYDLDGGEADNPTIYTAFDDDFTLEAPVKSGYVFLGWTNDSISEPTIDVTIEKGTEGDLEFTANYRLARGIIHFNKNSDDATGEMADLVVENGETLTLPTIAYTREHYIFVGWSGEPEPTNTLIPDCYSEGPTTLDVDEEITLYAIWQESIVTVTTPEISNELTNYSNLTSFKHYEGTPDLTKDNVEIINDDPNLPVYIIYNDDYTEAAWWSEAEKISLGEDCDGMFSHLPAMTEIDLSDFDGSKIKTMEYMFDSSYHLTSIILPDNIDEAEITNLEGAFSFTDVKALDLSKIDLSSVKNFTDTFNNDHALKSITFNSDTIAKPKDLTNMFNMCENLIDLDLSWLDTSEVTNMSGLFAGLERIETITLSDKFTTSNVTDMSCMLNNTSMGLLDVVVPRLDTGKVQRFTNMFGNIHYYGELNLSHLDLRNATDCSLMFYFATIQNLNFSTTLLPTNAIVASNMFNYFNHTYIYVNENLPSLLSGDTKLIGEFQYK